MDSVKLTLSTLFGRVYFIFFFFRKGRKSNDSSVNKALKRRRLNELVTLWLIIVLIVLFILKSFLYGDKYLTRYQFISKLKNLKAMAVITSL